MKSKNGNEQFIAPPVGADVLDRPFRIVPEVSPYRFWQTPAIVIQYGRKGTVISMNDKYPSRKQTRLKTYDYNSVGAYFITICTANRVRILSTISDPSRVDLTDIGLIVKNRINILNDHYKNISIDHYVIMPDHIHIIYPFSKITANLQNNTPNSQNSSQP